MELAISDHRSFSVVFKIEHGIENIGKEKEI